MASAKLDMAMGAMKSIAREAVNGIRKKANWPSVERVIRVVDQLIAFSDLDQPIHGVIAEMDLLPILSHGSEVAIGIVNEGFVYL